MTYSSVKSLAFLLTSVFILVIVYHCYDEISSLERTVNIYIRDDQSTQEKRKFVTILSKNNEIKMVYMDNDNMDDMEDQPHHDSLTNTSEASVSSSYYQSSNYASTDNPYGFEWDETIDYDYYEKRAGTAVSNETKRLTDLKEKPKNTIVLVHQRYHSNDAITNIMYRYGDLNQLSFALPKKSTFRMYRPLKFHPSFVDTGLTFSDHVNMLINPTYRYETLKRFMPKDTVFIAVLHDPVTYFFSKLIQHPLLIKYEPKKRLKIVKNLVERNKVFRDKYTNTISSEFGYPSRNLTKEIIDKLKIQFDIVLMGAYLDESLIVLKNVLNWSLTDLVHISRKQNVNYDGNIPTQIQDAIKEHVKQDQAVYEHFNITFWEKVKSYGSNFSSDLQELKRLNRKLTNYCEGPFGDTTSIEVDTVCTRMKWGDREYVRYLKKKYQVMSNTALRNSAGLQYLKNSLEFYFNTTSKEIQRYLESSNNS